MKIAFAVMTEGNGHAVQALAMQEILSEMGYKVDFVLGAAKGNSRNPLLVNNFNVIDYKGIDFVFSQNGGITLLGTAFKFLRDLPEIIKSFKKIYFTIKKESPDLIINFYEPMVGVMALFFPRTKFVTIGHQHAMVLDCYPKINGFYIQKVFLRLLNFLTSIKSHVIALSFYPIDTSENKNKFICPPILRVNSYLTSDKKEDFILVYLMNKKVLPQLITEAVRHSDKKIECFTKFDSETDLSNHSQNLPANIQLFSLNGKTFQDRMKVCRGVVCSGGFETASEAMINQKPLLMVPLQNHFEQKANCNDAVQAGLAQSSDLIDLSVFDNYTKCKNKDNDWRRSYKNLVIDYLKKIIK